VATTSGLSLGSANWPNNLRLHRVACYEAANSHHFYGVALHSHNVTGLAFYSSTGGQVPYADGLSTGGVDPHMFIDGSSKNVGIATLSPQSKLHVNGSFQATTKSFVIDHPSKNGWQLRHWCVEGDAPGGSLLYSRQITAPKAGVVPLIMPDWFAPLAKNVMCFATPFKHFGAAWGEQDELDPCVIHIHCSRGGLFNILITADRNDICATQMCPQEVEFEEQIPENTGI
jgi:hypothetical protein